MTTLLGMAAAPARRERCPSRDSKERNRACYQHCVLRYVSGGYMTNASLRQRFGIAEKNAAKASRLIKEAVTAGLIKLHAADVRDRDRKYVPFWADPS